MDIEMVGKFLSTLRGRRSPYRTGPWRPRPPSGVPKI